MTAEDFVLFIRLLVSGSSKIMLIGRLKGDLAKILLAMSIGFIAPSYSTLYII